MPENRTLDNPNDIAIREDQKRLRLEMGRAESRVKDKRLIRQYSESFIFRFRKIRNGSFAGLWELCALNKKGEVEETITDADALPYVLDSIGNIFANKGF